MRKFPAVILFVLVALSLVTSVTGCHRAQRYDSRLVAADSLMRRFPDSALAIVEALCPDSLAAEGDRAYRALLLTQARYKSYIPATSDSAISRALAYYCAHSDDREKLTRAYIYKGAVMEELGHPDSAMLHYKHAEATADTSDYNMMGYINLRIAELYQSVYYNDSAVVSRMKNAKRYFSAINDTGYLITCIGTQGLFENIVGKDTARHYLEKAVSLGKKTQDRNRFFYQSKLAGICFYENDYYRAKDLSLDIIINGREYCDEDQFYYYAARSYVKLNLIDSARWVKSMIPTPYVSVDSLNMQLLQADLLQANNDYHGAASHIHEADLIEKRLMQASAKSPLTKTELKFDARHQENELKADNHSNMLLILGVFLLVVVAIIICFFLAVRLLNRRYSNKLDIARNDLEMLIAETDQKIRMLELDRDENRRKLAEKSHELDVMEKKNSELLSKQTDIASQVSDVVRLRNMALSELYQGIRVKTDNSQYFSVIPLAGLLKELIEKKRILHKAPKESFWNNLRLSVDAEFNGIASYVENMYPSLTPKEHRLFWLLCAGLPNQIIRICMDFSTDVTVSNNKKRLLKKMALDMKFEDFVSQYLQGKRN